MQRWLGGVLVLSIVGHLAVPSTAEVTKNSNLTVAIDGLKSQRGQVCLTLFSNDQGFPSSSNRALKAQCVKVAAGTSVAATFRNLPAGSYAVAVIHDANGDGALNRAFLGIPTEGFGFSRNPKVRLGPPRFKDSVISVAGPATTTRIQLQYLLGG